jgi:hypothetical protein
MKRTLPGLCFRHTFISYLNNLYFTVLQNIFQIKQKKYGKISNSNIENSDTIVSG